MLPLEKAVALLSLDASYAKVGPEANLLASSLQRKFQRGLGIKGLKVGTANRGAVITFRLVGKRLEIDVNMER